MLPKSLKSFQRKNDAGILSKWLRHLQMRRRKLCIMCDCYHNITITKMIALEIISRSTISSTIILHMRQTRSKNLGLFICIRYMARNVECSSNFPLEKTLMLEGIGGRRRRGRQRMRWLDGITDLVDVSFEWTPGVGDGQGGLACCNSWGRKESDTTERLNWTEQQGDQNSHP